LSLIKSVISHLLKYFCHALFFFYQIVCYIHVLVDVDQVHEVIIVEFSMFENFKTPVTLELFLKIELAYLMSNALRLIAFQTFYRLLENVTFYLSFPLYFINRVSVKDF
jgi:hypothetical protein